MTFFWDTLYIKSRHQNEDVKYPCGLCGYQAKGKSNLSAHNRTIHHISHKVSSVIIIFTFTFFNVNLFSLSQIKSDEDKSMHQRIRI